MKSSKTLLLLQERSASHSEQVEREFHVREDTHAHKDAVELETKSCEEEFDSLIINLSWQLDSNERLSGVGTSSPWPHFVLL